ncbi:MAG: hypothetical protein AAF547_25265 [Actinomycetota bacterium]
MAALDDAFVAGLVDASAGVGAAGRSATVAITIGKTQSAILEIVDGRVVGGRVGPAEEDEVGVTVPVTGDQLAAFCDGSASVAQDYMRGDLKPVGSTGALLAFVELFENPDFRAGLPG